MGESLAWALNQAREQTLALVADVSPDAVQRRAAPEERHPAWILGHLLLADSYLLHLLAIQPLADDLPVLLARYGPASAPNATTPDDSKDRLIDRLRQSNVVRVARVSAMTDHELASPLGDPLLARVQPTIGHHLQSLVFHEGYHAGQHMNRHYDHPILMLQHMVWHEGYHHGQIKLALKVAGRPLADKQVGRGTWGIWMRKQNG